MDEIEELMDRIAELKKQLKCEKCHQKYNKQSTQYLFKNCGHHTCSSCYRNNYAQCPKCSRSSYPNQDSFPYDAYIELNSLYESSAEFRDAEENDLRERISTLEQEKAEWDAAREDHYKCAECGTSESEQNMQLCSTCHDLKFKNLEDLKKHAMCSTCAIKKHIRQGHQTVDFYPYLSAFNLLSDSSKTKSQSENLEKTRNSLTHMFSDFNNLSINVSESYDVLTDMARRSKSTKNQLELIGKMETFVNESKSIHDGAATDLKKHTKSLQDSLIKMKDWYKKKLADCVDESEVIKLDISTISVNNKKDSNNASNTAGTSATRKSQRKRSHP